MTIVASHLTDVDLVKNILRPWVSQGVRPAEPFYHAADLYAGDPGDLARRFRAAVATDGERAWYFLSPLRTKSPRGRRKARTVAHGAGWWHGEAGPRPVVDPLDGRRKVGYRQSFSFMRRGDDGAAMRTAWIMVELRLCEEDEDGRGGGIGERLEGLVLCKVYRSPRHPDTAAEANDGGHQEVSCAATAPASSVVFVDDDGSSDAPIGTGGKRKAEDDEGSSAASPMRHVKISDEETSGAAAPMTPGPKEEEAACAENESSGATMAAAARRREEENKAADDDEDSSASTPATRKRERDADDEAAGVASARKMMAAAQHLHCPQCGFHIGALQAVVGPAKSSSETETETGIAPADAPRGAGTGDASGSGKDSLFHRFL